MLSAYRAVPGTFDELLDDAGHPRGHYAEFVRQLEELPTTELRTRWETSRRLIHEQGITYNVYNDPQGTERPWQLDPVPYFISAAEWRSLEAALVQRATLLNKVLADCYGPQELIRAGRFPSALVFAQPDFLRACHGIRPAQDVFSEHFAGAEKRRSVSNRSVA